MSAQKLLVLFVFAFLTISELNGQLTWDDPAIAEGPCDSPNHVQLNTYFLAALSFLPQGFKLYSPMGNKAYFRWMYQKATNEPATTQAQIDSLKPRTTDPLILSLLSLREERHVEIFDPPTASYHMRCIPTNAFLTNATCNITNASPGSAPEGFGGSPICNTMIWNDFTAWAEWHCLAGGHQVFNVLSSKPTLTQAQITSIKAVVTKLGFKTENFEYQVYT